MVRHIRVVTVTTLIKGQDKGSAGSSACVTEGVEDGSLVNYHLLLLVKDAQGSAILIDAHPISSVMILN